MNDLQSNLASYIKNVLSEKNLSMYEVSKRSGGEISYTYVRQIANGLKKNPNASILRVLARAIQVPYTDLLKAAGYITESDHQDINEMLRDMLKPMFDDNIVDVLCDEQMLEILGDIMKVDGENRQNLINGLRTFARGFVGGRKD